MMILQSAHIVRCIHYSGVWQTARFSCHGFVKSAHTNDMLPRYHGLMLAVIKTRSVPIPVLTIVIARLGSRARAANTVGHYWPNHPGYAKQYFIELYLANSQNREFEFSVMGGAPDKTIYVAFVRRLWGGIRCYGNCKSAALFDWLNEQTLNQSPNSERYNNPA
jgi:hypothetical protein